MVPLHSFMRAVSSWLKFMLLAHLTLVVMVAYAWTPAERMEMQGALPAEAVMATAMLSELTEAETASADDSRVNDGLVKLPCGDDDRGEPYPVQSCVWPGASTSVRHRHAASLAQPGPWLRLPLRPPQPLSAA